jgi:hypothetical protein
LNTDVAELKVQLVERMQEVAEFLLPNGQLTDMQWTCGSAKGEPGQSLNLELYRDKAGLWHDFATREGGDILDLWQSARGVNFKTALEEAHQFLEDQDNLDTKLPVNGKNRVMSKHNGKKKPRAPMKPKSTHTWHYRDSAGKVIGKVVRWDAVDNSCKQVKPYFKPDGNGGFTAGIPAEINDKRPLYGDHPDKNGSIIITEGEKAADAVRQMGFRACTSLGGCGAPAKTNWSPLKGVRQVLIWADNDEPGIKYADAVANIIHAIAPDADIRILTYGDTTEDAADFVFSQLLEQGWGWNGYEKTPEIEKLAPQFMALTPTAEKWQPPEPKEETEPKPKSDSESINVEPLFEDLGGLPDDTGNGTHSKQWFNEGDLPDGLVGDIARYCLASSHVPNPLFSVGAGLLSVSLLSRNRYLVMPTETTLNLNIIEVGPTSAGKEALVRAIKNIFAHLDAGDRMVDDVASGVALQRALHDAPDHTVLFWRDEVWELLMAASGQNGSPHARSIVATLMTLYAQANGLFAGKAYGNNTHRIPAFDRPYLVFAGATTPERFTEALSSKHVADGFLNRLIVLQAQGDPADFNFNVKSDLPADLATDLKQFFQPQIINADKDPNLLPRVKIGCQSDAALEILKDFMQEARTKSTEDVQYGPLWNRAGENAFRVAGNLAVGVDPVAPAISVEQAEWATWFIRNTMQSFAITLNEHLAESAFDAKCKKAYSYIRDAFNHRQNQRWGHLTKYGMPRGLLTGLMKMKARDLNDVTDYLIISGQIEELEHGKKDQKKTTIYRINSSRPKP